MPVIPLTQTSSVEAILNSITYDVQVSRWFGHLLLSPKVQSVLAGKNQADTFYRQLRLARAIESLILAALALSVFISYLTHSLLPSVGLVVVTAFPFIRMSQEKNKSIRQLAEILLLQDFSREDLKQKTLFQVGEFYHRRFAVLSLLDFIAQFDALLFIAMLPILLLPFLNPTVPPKMMIISWLLGYLICFQGIGIFILNFGSSPKSTTN